MWVDMNKSIAVYKSSPNGHNQVNSLRGEFEDLEFVKVFTHVVRGGVKYA